MITSQNQIEPVLVHNIYKETNIAIKINDEIGDFKMAMFDKVVLFLHCYL